MDLPQIGAIVRRMESREVPLGRIFRLARPELGTLLWGVFFLVISSAAGLAYPQAIRALVDDALSQKSIQSVDRVALIMAVVLVVQGLATALRYVLFTTVGERVVTRLRSQLYAALLRQEVAYFDVRRTGELTSRLASDTTVIQNAVSVNISMALRSAATAIGGVVLLFVTSPKLTVLMLAVVPAVALGAVIYGRKVRALARHVQDALARANAVADETLAGIRTVRSFAAESAERQRYDTAVESSLGLALRRVRLSGVFMAVSSTAAFGAAALVVWYGGRLVLAHELSVGALTSFVVYTMFVGFALGTLTDLWADFTRARGASERVFEVIDRAPVVMNGTKTLPAPRGDVALEHVTFAYPSRPDATVLADVDLALRQGEVVAVVGPSGAGKSTIAQLLSRLYDPTQGRVVFDGVDVKELDAEWLRRQIGVVSQEPLLFSLPVRENIRYARPSATDAEVEAAAKAAHAHEFVSKFPDGYATEVGERGVQLSGGQKQRIAIARAVLKDPRVLVLDEATSALDAESEHLVQDALDRLKEGRTTLIIAHRLSTVVNADRVVVLEHGVIVQEGRHEDLARKDGTYRKLVERQFVAS